MDSESLHTDIPTDCRGDQVFFVFEILSQGQRSILHATGTIGVCQDLSTLQNTLGISLQELFSIRGLSEEAVRKIEESFPHIANTIGLSRTNLMRALMTDQQ